MSDPFRATRFLTSAHDLHQLPPDAGCEVVFAGRSNSGKSSVINRLTGQKQLARSGKTPGRTQLINFFAVTGSNRLVDLPGYGYARVSQRQQAHWGVVIHRFLEQRRAIRGLVLIVDCRRGLRAGDDWLVDWATRRHVPTLVVLNKADKLGRSAITQVERATASALGDQPGRQTLVFSAVTGRGLESLAHTVQTWLTGESPPRSD